MSGEILEIAQEMNLKKMEIQMVLQCAPLLAGLKISNLLTVSGSSGKLAVSVLYRTGISCYPLVDMHGKTVFLLYRKKKLEQYLKGEAVQQILLQEHYKNPELDSILHILRVRYEKYINGEGSFPHELGLLLGYPAEDVKGFVKHKGKHFLYSGYWKVYEYKPEKIALFHQFEEAKKAMLSMVLDGMSIPDIIESYQKEIAYPGNRTS